MIADEVFYFYKRAIPPKICDEIISYGNSLIKEQAAIGNLDPNKAKTVRPLKKTEKEKHYKIRKSKIAWIKDPWVYREIQPYIYKANSDAKWNFQLHGFEAIQFTQYAKNEHYDYHVDTFFGCGDQTRKLSMTVNLSNPNDYEGGDLYFKYLQRHNHMLIEHTAEELRERGTVCVFPSYEAHKVTPVTKGVRHSLVLWSTGKEFK